MTCIKTGARVHFQDYGIIVAADLYRVGNVTIIRWNEGAFNIAEQATPEDIRHASHSVSLKGHDLWHRVDLGVTVVQATMIQPVTQPEEITP